MQQQICQPEQLGQQQQPQQVMLCPVRLIYETQILVQPGEQIQPNQTLFINPQNPPPWIQNRPQNQVIYMQQLPNNMMPSMPQHMDQNQMYLQNLQNYYPQQMIQVDQMRQMPNVVHMVPNVNNINQLTTQNVNNMGQSVINVSQNVSNITPNVNMNAGQNVMPMANVVQNVNQKPANVGVNVAQNASNDARIYNPSANVMPSTIQMTSQQNTMQNVTQMQERTVNMNQNLVNMQKVAELQGVRPQNVRQPQVTVSPMQNVKFAPNVSDVRPISTPNIVDNRTVNSPRPMNVATIANIPNNVVQVNAISKKGSLPNKPNPNIISNQVRHYNQTYYRPIQPRPMSVMPMVQNQYVPIGTQTINVPRPTQIVNDVNRKRKSESPDETREKIPNINQTVTSVPNVGNLNQTMSAVPSMTNRMINIQSDIGVNTSPVHREIRPVRSVETASTGTQANIVRQTEAVAPVVKDNVQIESDKLVRNTVFTQARGLLRTEPQIMQPDVISIQKIETIVNPGTVNVIDNVRLEPRIKVEEAAKLETPKQNPETVKIEPPKHISETVKIETPKQIPQTVKIETPKQIPVTVKTETITSPETKPKKIIKQEVQLKKDDTIKEAAKPDVKLKTTPEATKTEAKPIKIETKDVKEVSKKFSVTAISDFKGSELQIADGSVKKESDSYILTHVLDGYVIQESNTAFPIRKPLKEKAMYQNTDVSSDQKKQEASYKHRTEDGKLIKDNSKILTISDLNLNEDDKITEEKTEEKCNEEHPFANLKPATIKSWTVDQLAAHLSKYNWSETISVLSEHEIDGESLFLVSKQQLVQIGVNEAHAEAICEFMKKT